MGRNLFTGVILWLRNIPSLNLTNDFVHLLLPQLDSIGVPNEEANRRELREMLFTSPDIEKYISGVVSFYGIQT